MRKAITVVVVVNTEEDVNNDELVQRAFAVVPGIESVLINDVEDLEDEDD